MTSFSVGGAPIKNWPALLVVSLIVATSVTFAVSVSLERRRAEFTEALDELGEIEPMKRTRKGTLVVGSNTEVFIVETERMENEDITDFDARHLAKISEAEVHYGTNLTWDAPRPGE